MQTDLQLERRLSWSKWAASIRRRGLEDVAAWVLEAAGPLTVIGAQLLYAGGPLLRPMLSDTQVDELANLLENNDEARAFVSLLREEVTP
jgi:hypothetical protein